MGEQTIWQPRGNKIFEALNWERTSSPEEKSFSIILAQLAEVAYNAGVTSSPFVDNFAVPHAVRNHETYDRISRYLGTIATQSLNQAFAQPSIRDILSATMTMLKEEGRVAGMNDAFNFFESNYLMRIGKGAKNEVRAQIRLNPRNAFVTALGMYIGAFPPHVRDLASRVRID